jgi:hypothetical protein
MLQRPMKEAVQGENFNYVKWQNANSVRGETAIAVLLGIFLDCI